MEKLLEVREFDSITGNADYKEDERYKYLPKPAFHELIKFIHEFAGNEETADALQFMKIGYKRNVGEVVSVKNYVGLIQLQNGFQIQILPKIDFGDEENASIQETKKVFLKMLRSMKDFPSKVFNDANVRVDQMNLYEIFINMYLQEVRQLVKRGMKSTYVGKEENRNYFKGKLVIHQHLKSNISHKERFYVSYEEYLPDCPENKLIKSTLMKLQKLTISAKNGKAIRQLLTAFEMVSPSVNYERDFSKVVINRSTKEYEQKPVTAGDLHAEGAMTALLKDALKPNLVQTLEHVPAIVHGGPFANIAHGCNSVTATKMALKLADYAITEAGFGADLGAEKFLDIKCRMAGLKPSAVVIVATVRALKYNGGVAKADLNNENLVALEAGLPNLLKHVSNIKNVYGLPCVVAINAFPTDTKAELDLVEAKCKELGVNVALSEVWAKGGEGGMKLAEEVIKLVEEPNNFNFSYDLEGSIEDKLNAIVTKIYGGKRVVLTANAQKQAKELTALGFDKCPICVAKTQYSLTDDQTKLGAPTDFEVTVRNLKISAGAGFIVALTGEIMTMPGLPKVPAAEKIDVDETGKITGLF